MMFPSEFEAEILQKHKKKQGIEPKLAKLKYVQLCQCPILVDDSRLKVIPVGLNGVVMSGLTPFSLASLCTGSLRLSAAESER